MSIVVRNNISSKLKNPTSAIGYYSYTNRCVSYSQPHILALSVFADTLSNALKTKRAKISQRSN